MSSFPRHRTVADVMTERVHVASPMTPFKLLVRLIEENRVSAIPIVDQHGVPVGVVSESDLLLKERFDELESTSDLLHPRRHSRELAKAGGMVAADLMSSPAITIASTCRLIDAARLMQERKVRRLVVVDERGKIAGILSRSDILQVFLRSDEDLREEIVEGLIPSLMLDHTQEIAVDVRYNVVTLDGDVDRRSDVDVLGRLTRNIDGVVGVINRLKYRWDDTELAAVPSW
ncbi:MAG TPA: CBS domain-containing protein [Candidatus Dormibacteraeota bacterium]|nr:CBS domain-containing protein [Candidatus Dormibacteraeota bacterium]